ncbi:MAG TPA: YciI family protein [Reyranella sp.]|nr:YciI family protein [Reyranella sp.]
MRFMILVKANEDSEAGVMPTTELLAEMGKFNEELVKAGVMLDGDGLKATRHAVRIDYDAAGKPTVVDGPFAEVKELVAGYWILELKDIDEAIAWLKRAPFRGGTVEIRPYLTAEDFGEAFTPELQQHEADLRAQAAAQKH